MEFESRWKTGCYGRSSIDPNDATSRPFGIGATHPYAMFLWSAQQYSEVDLVLPDGGRVHYVRTSLGTGYSDWSSQDLVDIR